MKILQQNSNTFYTVRQIDVRETFVEHHNEDATYGDFSHVLWMSPNKFYVNIEATFYVSLYMFTYILYIFTYCQY